MFPRPTADPAAAKMNVVFPCQILLALIAKYFIKVFTSYTKLMVKNNKLSKKPIIENRQAKFNYELGESFEAGISLLGWEVKSIRAARVDIKDIKSLGITNQRETTIAWSKSTGKPFYNALVWQDTRTQDICDEISSNNKLEEDFKKTGLPIATYFSLSKILFNTYFIAGLLTKNSEIFILSG